MTSAYRIALARPHDLGALADIELAAATLLVGHAPAAVTAETTSFAAFAEAQANDRLWVALADEVAVGFALVQLLPDQLPHLEELGVHPAHGRRGLGTALLQAVCAWTARAGHAELTLTTFRRVRWNLPFYARHGFEEIPRDALRPALVEIVRDETARGLAPDARAVMMWQPRLRGGSQIYDRIGGGYALRRRADARLARLIHGALGDADSVVNVGAGAGSYEPSDRRAVAVEPALTMIAQRPAGAAPVVRAAAEALPFGDDTFAAGLAVLTIHHWSNWRAGLRELMRVVRKRIVIFTWDPDACSFWLGDYLPGLLARDRAKFPSLTQIQTVIGAAEVTPVPIPHDCSDGFLGAYWRRPEAYLAPEIRQAISSLASEEAGPAFARLGADLESGAWKTRHRDLTRCEEKDIGYRLICCEISRT